MDKIIVFSAPDKQNEAAKETAMQYARMAKEEANGMITIAEEKLSNMDVLRQATDAAAARAEMFGPRTFDGTASLVADNNLTVENTPIGAAVDVRAGNPLVRVSPSETADVESAGGLKFNVDMSSGKIAAPALWLDGGTRADWMRLIQAASREVSSKWYGRKVEIPAGKYTWEGTIRVPPFLRPVVNGSVEINPGSEHPPGMPLIQFAWDEESDPRAAPAGYSQNPFTCGTLFDGSTGAMLIRDPLKRPGMVGARLGIDALTGGDHRRHLAWSEFKSLQFQDIDIGLQFSNKQNYIMRLYNFMFSGCGTPFEDLDTPIANSGEQINWFAPSFHNSDRLGVLNRQINHTMYGASLDFCTRGFEINGDYCQLRFLGGWKEKSNTQSPTPAPNVGLSSDMPFVKSNVATAEDGRQVHVTVADTHFFPRDRIPAQMFQGYMTLDFHGNQMHLQRYINKDSPQAGDATRRRAEGLFICDDKVDVIRFEANSNLEQPMFSSPRDYRNYNAYFGQANVGTVADRLNPNTIGGWTVKTNIGQATYTVKDGDTFFGGKHLEVVPGSGNFLDITSKKFSVNHTDRLFGDAILKIPTAMSEINITLVINFYDIEGNPLDAALNYSNERGAIRGNEGGWISTLSGMGNNAIKPPAGAFSASVHMEAGLLAGNTIKIGGILVNSV